MENNTDRGAAYALGRKCDWDLWKQFGYKGMGSVDLIRELLQSAEKTGVKEKSIAWYLLRDVERGWSYTLPKWRHLNINSLIINVVVCYVHVN